MQKKQNIWLSDGKGGMRPNGGNGSRTLQNKWLNAANKTRSKPEEGRMTDKSVDLTANQHFTKQDVILLDDQLAEGHGLKSAPAKLKRKGDSVPLPPPSQTEEDTSDCTETNSIEEREPSGRKPRKKSQEIPEGALISLSDDEGSPKAGKGEMAIIPYVPDTALEDLDSNLGGRSEPGSPSHMVEEKISRETVPAVVEVEAMAGKKTRVRGASNNYHELVEGRNRSLVEEDELCRQETEMHRKVQRTLREYNTYRLWYLQEKEVRGKPYRRPDLTARTVMAEKKKLVNVIDHGSGKFSSTVGRVPGVPVGMQFQYRQELAVIGLNVQIQRGIDYLNPQFSEYDVVVATCVVASGGYEDDVDDGEWMDYTGEGGNNYRGDRKQVGDQAMSPGNRGLINNHDLSLPVRVVRGFREANSATGMIYSYDGLYNVESWRAEKGESGFDVFKFRLRRCGDQPPLKSTALVEFARTSLKDDAKSRDRSGVVTGDLSNGAETIPVCCVNTVDFPLLEPPTFQYIAEIEFPSHMDRSNLKPQEGCKCNDGCANNTKCGCAKMNGGMLPYGKDGVLMAMKKAVFECGSNCSCACGTRCDNRVVQKGIKYRFEVYKTKYKGWAVRSWDAIPMGGFICEYIGELLSDEEAEKLKEDDEYLYNLDFVKGNLERWGDVSDVLGLTSASTLGTSHGEEEENDVEQYCLDAKKKGNFARFINHSCDPNIAAQCVFYDHHDTRFPRIAFFALENIRPLQELTYDYGYTLDGVLDEFGKPKKLACHCNAQGCRKWLY